MLTQTQITAIETQLTQSFATRNCVDQNEVKSYLQQIMQSIVSTCVSNSHNFFTVGRRRQPIGTFQFNLPQGITVAIEHTSHDISQSEPTSNIASIRKFRKFYNPNQQEPNITNYLYVLVIQYDSSLQQPTNIQMKLIEHIPFTQFTGGSIGGGQLQINNLDLSTTYNGTRNDWMKEFYDHYINLFLPRTIDKLKLDIINSQNEKDLW